jgi:hypothetical protein
LDKVAAANQRFFLCGGYFSNKKLAKVVGAKFPDLQDKLPSGMTPGGDMPATDAIFKIDTRHAEDVFDMKWSSFEKAIEDTVRSLQSALH